MRIPKAIHEHASVSNRQMKRKFQIDLEDEVGERLDTEAQRQKVTPEALLEAWINVKVGYLNAAQRKAVRLFKKKLAQEMPELHIAWGQPYNDTIIDLHIEYDKRTYRKSLKASKLACEVGEKTDVSNVFS